MFCQRRGLFIPAAPGLLVLLFSIDFAVATAGAYFSPARKVAKSAPKPTVLDSLTIRGFFCQASGANWPILIARIFRRAISSIQRSAH